LLRNSFTVNFRNAVVRIFDRFVRSAPGTTQICIDEMYVFQFSDSKLKWPYVVSV